MLKTVFILFRLKIWRRLLNVWQIKSYYGETRHHFIKQTPVVPLCLQRCSLKVEKNRCVFGAGDLRRFGTSAVARHPWCIWAFDSSVARLVPEAAASVGNPEQPWKICGSKRNWAKELAMQITMFDISVKCMWKTVEVLDDYALILFVMVRMIWFLGFKYLICSLLLGEMIRLIRLFFWRRVETTK